MGDTPRALGTDFGSSCPGKPWSTASGEANPNVPFFSSPTGDIHQKDATYPWQLGHLQVICTESLPSCLTLCNPIDYSPPGSSVHGILQAIILEWVSRPWSKGSSQPRDWTHISYVSCLGNLVLYHWVTRHNVSLKRRHLLKILSRGLKVHRHSHLSRPTSLHVLQLCPHHLSTLRLHSIPAPLLLHRCAWLFPLLFLCFQWAALSLHLAGVPNSWATDCYQVMAC